MELHQNRKLAVGLTGGIGSGKTTIANLFAELGIDIIDADKIARDVIEPGTEALQQVVAQFGDTILNTDGSLNRQQLKSIVFEDPQQRQWLEQLLHPLIRQQMQQQIDASQSAYCIVAIPLLLEVENRFEGVDRILVVDAPESVRVERVMQRDQLSKPEIDQIIASQVDDATRLQEADDVIINDGEHDLADQIAQLHALYLQLSAAN